MSNIGFKIVQHFDRPDTSLLQLFNGIPIPNIDDAMSRTAAIGGGIHSFNNTPLIGPAYTVNLPEGDNLLFYYAIQNANPGDVIVVANNGFKNRALCGEIMATWAQKRKLAGFVVDGSVRDGRELSAMNFPVFAINNIPNGPYKNGPGEINVPITVGGKVVRPGDIIIGDPDGLLVIRPEDAIEIAQKAHTVMEKERIMLENINTIGNPGMEWLDEKIKSNQVEFIDREA